MKTKIRKARTFLFLGLLVGLFSGPAVGEG